MQLSTRVESIQFLKLEPLYNIHLQEHNKVKIARFGI